MDASPTTPEVPPPQPPYPSGPAPLFPPPNLETYDLWHKPHQKDKLTTRDMLPEFDDERVEFWFGQDDGPPLVALLIEVFGDDEKVVKAKDTLAQLLSFLRIPVIPMGDGSDGVIAAFWLHGPGALDGKRQMWRRKDSPLVQVYSPGVQLSRPLHGIHREPLPWLAWRDVKVVLEEQDYAPTGSSNNLPDRDRANGWVNYQTDKNGYVTLVDKTAAKNVQVALGLMGYGKWLRFDEWSKSPQIRNGDGWRTLHKDDPGRLKSEVEANFGSMLRLVPAAQLVGIAAKNLAYENTIDPQVDAFKSVKWDGETNHYAELSKLLGQDPEDKLALEYVSLLVRGIVVRALHPGCSVPYCINIYSNRQGVGKSALLKLLGNGRHSLLEQKTFKGFEPEKLIREKGRGVSVLELAERETLSADGESALKSLLSSESTKVRDVYAAIADEEPIRFVIVGTTNNEDFLTTGGGRRDPVIRIPDDMERMDLAQVKALRPYLWAQAVAEYERGDFRDEDIESGVEVSLPAEFRDAALAHSARYVQSSPFRDALAALLDDPEGPGQTGRLWGKELTDWIKAEGYRTQNKAIKDSMNGLGWFQRQARNLKEWGEGRIRVSVWERKDPPPHPDIPPSALATSSWMESSLQITFPAHPEG